MKRSNASVRPWVGPAVGLAVAAAIIGSPRVRSQIASALDRLRESLLQGVEGVRSSIGTPAGGRTAAMDEMSRAADSATTQWESSMTVRKVAAALAEEPRLRRRSIEVRLIGGILHLEGEVHEEDEKRLAGEIVRRASGAQLVANDLRVAPPVG